MRKVKLLALLLAALMVVTAFAGCAGDTTEIQGEVDGLESRVEALESAIGNVQGGVSDLESSVSGIGSSIDANNTTIQGVLDALKDLESQLNEKPAETQAPVQTETQAPVGDSIEALKAKADALGALIGGLQAEVMAEKDEYLAADYVAALQALTAAHTEIAASNTVAAMDAVYAALLAKLDALEQVDEKFYNYYVQLKGNYTGDEACVALVEEALEWYEEADEHYDDADWYKDFATGEKDKKGNDITVDLSVLKAEMESWEEALEDVKDAAEAFVERIDDIKPDATYASLATLVGEITTWKKSAVALAPVHGNLVTNYADLEAALAASLNFTVAETLISALKIESVINEGATVALFADYFELVEAGRHINFVATNVTTANIDDVIYTADVYAAIDKAIEKWIDENDITETVAEFIINKAFGDGDEYFYAKYQDAKAFAATMAAEFETFKKDIAADFTALNSKTLANSQALVASYQANADELNAWYDAKVKAYADACTAADKADRNVKNYRVVKAAEYAAALVANFNEMVVLAGLGSYDAETKDTYFGTSLDYTLGVKSDANYNYIQFYSFDEATVEFLTTTYKAAKAEADAINNAIAKFPVLQQISVVEVLTSIGGYHEEGTLDKGTEYETKALLVIEDKDYVAGTIAAYMAKYGKGGSAYDEKSKADLSALVNTAAYDKLVADVFARIDEIDDATAALNNAYNKLLGTGDEAIITTANTADVAALVSAIGAWKNAGGRIEAMLTVDYKTVGNYKSYTLVKVVDAYASLKANPDFETVIKTMQTRSAAIVKEMNMLVSLYQMLDKVNAYSKITIDTLSSTSTSTIKNTNIAATGVAQRAANTEGKYDYDANYITFDGSKFKVATAYKIYGVEDKQVSSEAEKKAYSVIAGKGFATDLSVNKTLAEMSSAWKNKAFHTSDLIKIATALYDKFMVDNYGVKVDSVESAKASFVAANNGYELKGWIVDTINLVKAADQGYDVSSLKTVTTLNGLTTTLNAATAVLTADLAFGGYAGALAGDFALVGDTTYADLGIDPTDYYVDATIVWYYVPVGEVEPTEPVAE